jgi:hypothetical protein
MANGSYERRTFLKLMSTGIGASLVSLPQFGKALSFAPGSDRTTFILGKPEWILHEDGTYDIYAGNIRLTNCRPTINGQSIFIRNTFMGDSPKGKRIIYEIAEGFVMLDLRTHSNTISIGAEISGMKNAPVWFNPLGEGYLTGANRFFKQGFGTGGQSGIFDIPKSALKPEQFFPEENSWSYDSFLVTGLIAGNGDTLAIGAYEHADFIQRSTIFNQSRRKSLYNSRSGNDAVFFESGFFTESIPLKDESVKMPDLYIYTGNQPYGTMQNLAWSISEQNQARRDTDTNYFWSSYQDYRTTFTYKYLLDQLKILDELNPQVPFQTVYVGKGYCIPGDWLDPLDAWPKAFENVAREICRRLYRAGIYVAPFVVHEKSKIFRYHPRWILKDNDDNPVVAGFESGGTLYALDGSNPDVKDHIAKVFRSFQKMGFTYFELDYLEAGLRDSSEVQHSRKGKTSVQLFRGMMDLIREAVGPGSFLTANKAPYAPLLGYVDAMRIEKDQGWKWEEQTTGHILQESYNSQYFNNIFWQNDPDVVFLRNYRSEFTDDEQKSLAYWVGFMGGSIGISDNFSLMEAEKLRIWRFLEPNKRPQSASLPLWGTKIINKVAVRRLKNEKGWAVLILNDTDKPVSETYQINSLIGQKDVWIYVWEYGFSLGLGKGSRLTVMLGSHECKLYYLSHEKENPGLNLTIAGKEYSKE